MIDAVRSLRARMLWAVASRLFPLRKTFPVTRMPDRFDKSVDPRERFIVSPEAVEQAVRLIATRKLHLYRYDVDDNVDDDVIVERTASPSDFERG